MWLNVIYGNRSADKLLDNKNTKYQQKYIQRFTMYLMLRFVCNEFLITLIYINISDYF